MQQRASGVYDGARRAPPRRPRPRAAPRSRGHLLPAFREASDLVGDGGGGAAAGGVPLDAGAAPPRRRLRLPLLVAVARLGARLLALGADTREFGGRRVLVGAGGGSAGGGGGKSAGSAAAAGRVRVVLVVLLLGWLLCEVRDQEQCPQHPYLLIFQIPRNFGLFSIH